MRLESREQKRILFSHASMPEYVRYCVSFGKSFCIRKTKKKKNVFIDEEKVFSRIEEVAYEK